MFGVVEVVVWVGDIIFCVMLLCEFLVFGEWLLRSIYFDLVGFFILFMRECDDVCIYMSKVVVDIVYVIEVLGDMV